MLDQLIEIPSQEVLEPRLRAIRPIRVYLHLFYPGLIECAGQLIPVGYALKVFTYGYVKALSALSSRDPFPLIPRLEILKAFVGEESGAAQWIDACLNKALLTELPREELQDMAAE